MLFWFVVVFWKDRRREFVSFGEIFFGSRVIFGRLVRVGLEIRRGFFFLAGGKFNLFADFHVLGFANRLGHTLAELLADGPAAGGGDGKKRGTGLLL